MEHRYNYIPEKDDVSPEEFLVYHKYMQDFTYQTSLTNDRVADTEVKEASFPISEEFCSVIEIVDNNNQTLEPNAKHFESYLRCIKPMKKDVANALKVGSDCIAIKTANCQREATLESAEGMRSEMKGIGRATKLTTNNVEEPCEEIATQTSVTVPDIKNNLEFYEKSKNLLQQPIEKTVGFCDLTDAQLQQYAKSLLKYHQYLNRVNNYDECLFSVTFK